MKKSDYVIEKGEAHIWKLHLLEAIELLNYYGSFLSEAEKTRASKFKFAKDKNMFTFSHGVLRLLLARYLEEKPEDIRFQQGPFGKPFLSKNESLRFNLSHSGEMALIAFSNAEIGIDIEKVELKKDVLEVSKTVYSSDEVEELNAQKSDVAKVRFFYELWTRKEAYIKQLGFGLSMPVSLTDVSVLSEKIEIIQASEEARQRYGGRKLISFAPHVDYLAALAFAEPTIDLEFFNWEN